MFDWLRKPKITDDAPMRRYTARAAKQLDGAQAEALACAHLQKQGLKLIDANLACTRGEIDLLMLDGHTLVFIEVRWRKNAQFGGAAASVTAAKLKKLLTACEVFFQNQPNWRDQPCRVDVVALEGALSDPQIDWLKNVTG